MNAYLIYYESFWEMDREIRWGYWGNVHWAFHRGGFYRVLALILSCLLWKRYRYLISPYLNISDFLISLFFSSFCLFVLFPSNVLCSSLLFSFHFCLFSSHCYVYCLHFSYLFCTLIVSFFSCLSSFIFSSSLLLALISLISSVLFSFCPIWSLLFLLSSNGQIVYTFSCF